MNEHEEEIERKVAEFRQEIEGEDLNLYVKELRKSLPRKARWAYFAGNVFAGVLAVLIMFVAVLVVTAIFKFLLWIAGMLFS